MNEEYHDLAALWKRQTIGAKGGIKDTSYRTHNKPGKR